MTPRRTTPTVVLLLAAASLPCLGGCSGPNSLLASPTTVGSLRTSVSHLQHQNEQLKRQVADLKADTHNLEDQLVQEEARNGDLAARLDDARHALRGRGGDTSSSSVDHGPVDPPQRTLPAGQSSRKKRKAPFAQIPGPVDAPTPGEQEGAPVKDLRQDKFGPQSSRSQGSGWLPVARGPMTPFAQVR